MSRVYVVTYRHLRTEEEVAVLGHGNVRSTARHSAYLQLVEERGAVWAGCSVFISMRPATKEERR